jgi:selenocysteine lyase/cysteine desulfurase
MMGVAQDELSFGPSTTQNTYVLSQAFSQMLVPGEAIIVTNQDHEANSGPWRRLQEAGIEVREWGLDPKTGHLDINELQRLLDAKVRLVCFPHCSNVIGEINPVNDIVKIIHQAGAYACVDGVSYAPHGLPNMTEIKADIYLFSTYKTYGPHQGLMIVRRALGEKLPNQGHHFNSGTLYKRFTPAGPDHAQIAACAGIADYFDALYDHHFPDAADAVRRNDAVHDLMREWEIKLLQPLLDYVQSKNSVTLLGPSDAQTRAPTVAVKTERSPTEITQELAARGLIVGGDDFYAVRPLEAMGVDPKVGVLRMSFVHYTSEAEVQRLMSALDETL